MRFNPIDFCLAFGLIFFVGNWVWGPVGYSTVSFLMLALVPFQKIKQPHKNPSFFFILPYFEKGGNAKEVKYRV